MKTLCIDRPVAEKMKQAVKNGEINIKQLYEMTSAQRRGLFGSYASQELAQKINSEFEKAMISKQKTALKAWAESVFTPTQKADRNYKNIIDKINDLDKAGVLNPASSESFLEDLAAEKLGVSISPEEVKIISEKAKQLEEIYNRKTEDGIPHVEYWVKRKEMDDYLNSLAPSPRLRVLTSVAGRGAMLLSVKSPLTNIISNTVQGAVQGLERRISSKTYKGLNGDFALNYVLKVNDIFNKSGFDISRMETISQGQKRLGEEVTHSQGKGKSRWLGRFYEDFVFKKLMGAPDVAASSVAFADSANLSSSKIAEMEGLGGEKAKQRALEIFKDSVLIKPQTVEGEFVRGQAIADAMYSTYTNSGGYSDFAMAIRTALNNATGNFRLGDQLMPFVKTPANVVQAGVDAAGVGAIRAFYKLPEAIRQAKSGNGQPMQDVVRLFVRSGLGFTLAVVLAFAFRPEDFIGEYDNFSQKDRDLVKLKNAPYNSIKVGNKYISLDYFGPLASAFVGLMYARKYGQNIPEKIYQYGRGSFSQALKIPGLREFTDVFKEFKDAAAKGDLGEVAAGLSDSAVGYLRSRTIPAIVNDIAKGIDPYERKTGKHAFSKFQASLPGARSSLPKSISQVDGNSIKSEGFISTLLFGGRVKTANQSAIVKEINRLYGANAGPTIADIEYVSKRVKQLKIQISSEKYKDAIRFYGKTFGENAIELINSRDYQEVDDEIKQKALNDVRRDALNEMLGEFGYGE